MKLVEAQEGRRILDRIVGWETSPVLWRVFGRGQAASAGRVQSVAVRMVVERERARMRFRSGAVARPRRHVPRGDRHRAVPAPSLVELDGKPARRRPRLRSRRPASSHDGRDVVLLDGDAAEALADRLRDVPVRGRERRLESVHRTTARAVHDVDAATRVGPQASVHLGAHDGHRPAAVRAGLHHLHANRQHEPVGAGDLRRAQHRFASSTARTTFPTTHARTAARSKNAQEAHEAIRPAGDAIRTPEEVRSRARRRRAAVSTS